MPTSKQTLTHLFVVARISILHNGVCTLLPQFKWDRRLYMRLPCSQRGMDSFNWWGIITVCTREPEKCYRQIHCSSHYEWRNCWTSTKKAVKELVSNYLALSIFILAIISLLYLCELLSHIQQYTSILCVLTCATQKLKVVWGRSI